MVTGKSMTVIKKRSNFKNKKFLKPLKGKKTLFYTLHFNYLKFEVKLTYETQKLIN